MNVSLHGLPVALLARRPVVLSHHGDYRAPGLRNQALGCLKRQLTRRFPNIAVSGFVAAQLPGHCVVIPNAYDDRLFVSVNQRTRRRDFVFCGSLVSDKGVDVLLEAFAEVVEESPDATLTIIGEGPERRPLENWTRTHGLTGSAAFVGSLSGPPLASALSDHSCMVIPSLWNEPFGIVALEGIASCDTVISSYRGGLPEAVGGCGLLVEPSVTALADAMVSVVHARRAGLPLPGQPSAKVRADHLARHSSSFVSKEYLRVLAPHRDGESLRLAPRPSALAPARLGAARKSPAAGFLVRDARFGRRGASSMVPSSGPCESTQDRRCSSRTATASASLSGSA